MSELEFSNEPEFIQDGHVIRLVLDRDDIRISDIHCPNRGTTSLCNRRRTFCVVERFIEAFGIDLNLGKVTINGPIEIAWCPVNGDEGDLDVEFDSVWIVPVDDPQYQLMLADRDMALAAAGMETELPALESPSDDEVPPEDDEIEE